MNIISNTCIGAYLMRDYYHERFSNPFVWNIIDYKSFFNLIKKYNNLYKLKIDCIQNENINYPILKIGNDISIHYVHYKDERYKDIVPKNEDNVFLQNCANYALIKYNERIKRLNDNPIFILQIQSKHQITGNVNELNKALKDYNCNYNVIILTQDKNLIKTNKKNIKIIEIKDDIISMPKKLAEYVFSHKLI